LIALLGVAHVACESTTKAQPRAGAAQPQQPPAVVTTAQVIKKTVSLDGEFVGRTVARDVVRVVPRITGVIQSVGFTEGAVVKQGDVLFEIDKATYQTALASAEAKLAQDKASLGKVRRDLGRLQPLVADQIVSRQEVDSTTAGVSVAEAALRVDQAAIDRAQLDIGFTTITAPIDGVIGKLEVTVGNLVTSGQASALATLSSFDPMYVTFSVPEASYLALRRKHGDLVQAGLHPTLLLADGQPYEQAGAIDFVDRQLDPTTGTITVRARFPNADGFLKPGQFTRVRFEVDRVVDAVLVPRVSLTQVQSQRAVFVVDANNKVTMKPVTVGDEVGDRTIITSGLVGGETVVVEGTQKVRPGATVAPKPWVDPSAPAQDKAR